MDRRTVLKGGLVLAATSHVAALAPSLTDEVREDPRVTIRRLSHQISELLDTVPDYEQVTIKAKSVGRWAIYTSFTV
ncbi:hypothetical protein PH552_12460 [Rhizobium sp. CNPSo 3968]|uniref:hypothetical protein n=1 Tax=Rhizobium sp. CNPSo 3968 TaxID=3021408 RepID=UPI00254B94AF|nr:hypothetical protein [Rhizobium sp. CNPSo 3968]MDK4720157.1 hypothetical protein [Rhizobium sp. CNPSo 3968]